MTARPLLASLLLVPVLALGQVDDWSSFPSEPPAAAFVVTPFPEQAAATAPIPPPDAAPEGGTAVDGEAVLVSREESFEPGEKPHSPSTWGNAWNHAANLRTAPSAVGAVGLVNTSSAALGPKGLLRFSVVGEYFNRRDFPVRDAHHERTAGTFAASFVPLEWLETFLAYGASANSNDYSSPTLIQALGDVTLGVKASREWAKGLYAGLELRAQSFSGVGNQDLRAYAWGFSPRAQVTYDVRRPAPKVPLILHLNAGAQLDGTGGLVRDHTLNAPEEFSLGVNRYHRLLGAVALEVPLPVVTPFVEYDLGLPLGLGGGRLPSPDGVSTVSVGAAMPQRLGLGMKITAVRDLTFLAGANIGLSRTVGLGVPATPPWNLYLGAAFNVDPFARSGSKLVETVRERRQVVEVAPRTGRVEGVVVDAQTQRPLPGVIVAMVGGSNPPVASDAGSGRFLTHDAGAGPVTLRVEKEGYQELSHEVMLAAGHTSQIQLALQPLVKQARFLVTVVGKKKEPVASEVRFKGLADHLLATEAGSADPKVLDLPPGRYQVNVVAPAHLAQTREVQVVADAEMRLSFELEPEPTKRLVVVKEDKIEILQQVHFATAKATILADSFGLLNQVVDAIVQNDIRRIRVEGHTDNRGGKARNQTLSEQRAQAVVDYLVKQGIDSGRIETQGLGDERPVAPNLTARGRELNRRVEFHILER